MHITRVRAEFRVRPKGEAARDALQEIADNLDGCDFSNVSFPGMY
jgi:hypothetical protein